MRGLRALRLIFLPASPVAGIITAVVCVAVNVVAWVLAGSWLSVLAFTSWAILLGLYCGRQIERSMRYAVEQAMEREARKAMAQAGKMARAMGQEFGDGEKVQARREAARWN